MRVMRATSVIVAGQVSMRLSRVCLLQQAKCVHNDLIEQSEVKEKRGFHCNEEQEENLQSEKGN